MHVAKVGLFVLLICNCVFSATIRVPQDQTTIQAGINAAVNGDTVLVGPGIYVENLSLLGKTIVLTSLLGPDSTVLRSATSNTLIDCNGDIGSDAEISGFKFTNSIASHLIEAQDGCQVRIANNLFIGLTANLTIIFCNNSNPTIERNVFAFNSVGNACVGIYTGSSNAMIANNTFYSNGRGFYCLSGIGTAINNIVVLSQEYGISGSFGNLSYNDVWGNGWGDYTGSGPGNLSVDPRFFEATSMDLRLQFDSPCVDAGDPDFQWQDSDGTRNDMGAFALEKSLPLALGLAFDQAGNDSVSWNPAPAIYWSFEDTSGLPQQGYELQMGTDNDWTIPEIFNTGEVLTSDTSVIFSGNPMRNHNFHYLRVRVSNGQKWGSWLYHRLLTHFNSTVAVPSEQPTIQLGTNATLWNDTVLVSPGIYHESISIVGKQIVLASQGGWESTTILAEDTLGATISIDGRGGTSSTLVGFTIGGGGAAGVHCIGGAPKIVDCLISGNKSRQEHIGGGINLVSTSGALVESNLITGNTAAAYGSGVQLKLGVADTLRYNVIYGNDGLGCIWSHNESNNIVYNNTLIPTSFAAIVLNETGSMDARNNIIVAPGMIGIRSVDQGITSSFNCFWQCSSEYSGYVQVGNGDMIADPLFVGPSSSNYALQGGSPCIDAGDPGPEYDDLDGTRNDIGAIPFSDYPIVSHVSISALDAFHVTNHSPIISWRFVDTASTSQAGYQIQIGVDFDWVEAEMWNSQAIWASDTTAVYAGSFLLDGYVYFGRMRVHNDQEWGAWVNFQFRMNSRPSIPILGQPLDNSLVPNTNPILAFKKSHDAQTDSLRYFLDLSTDAFQSTLNTWIIVGDADTLVSFTIDSDLLENAHYWWRVRASDYFEESEYSEVRQFWVNAANAAPSAFSLLMPANAASPPVSSVTPLFSWEPASDNDPMDLVSYFLYLSIDSNFNFVATTYELGACQFTPPDPLEWGRRYWWKVKATDLNGGETWSSQVFRFRIMTPGDADGSGVVTISDVVFLINYIFSGGPAPNPLSSGDADCTGVISISDAVYLIQYIFSGGPSPCGDQLLSP